MPVEGDFDNIDSLEPTFPFDDDQVAEGPQHLRGIKNALQGNVTGDDLETRLLVNNLVKALLDATGLTLTESVLLVQGALIDLDNSANDEITIMRLRNSIGGFSLEQFDGPGGTLFLRQIDSAGGTPKNVGAFERDGAVSWRFDGTEMFRTQAINAGDNSSLLGKDAAGVLLPLGYNTMPTNVGGNSVSFTLDSNFIGRRIRPNSTITITIVPTSLNTDGVVVVTVVTTGTVTILASGGATFTLFKPGGNTNPTSFTLSQGDVITIVRLQESSTYEIWGSGL